jgi:S-adenosylmethionine-dependent methyltransferase
MGPAGRTTDTVDGVGSAATGGPVHAALRAEVDRVRGRRADRAPQVLDVGGGSGGWAVPLARLGCAVTVVDNSPNALAALDRRARDAGVDRLVTAVQGDVDALADVAPTGGADLVLGHGLLEVVDDAAAAVAALRLAAAPGGAVSALVAGRYAAVLARTLSGKLTEARAVLTDPDGRFGPGDALRRRLDATALRELLSGGGLLVELLQGDGVLDAWIPGAVRDSGPSAARTVAELERLAAGAEPLRDVATRLHALARRPA